MKPLLLVLSVLGLTASLLISAGAHAKPNGHYRWTDDKGVVQYSDRPPEGVESEFIAFTGSKKSPADNTEKSSATQAGDAKTEQQAKLEVLPEKDPAICKQAQQNLKALDGARIRMTDTDGSQRYLTEEEKQEQRDTNLKFIKLHC